MVRFQWDRILTQFFYKLVQTRFRDIIINRNEFVYEIFDGEKIFCIVKKKKDWGEKIDSMKEKKKEILWKGVGKVLETVVVKSIFCCLETTVSSNVEGRKVFEHSWRRLVFRWKKLIKLKQPSFENVFLSVEILAFHRLRIQFFFPFSFCHCFFFDRGRDRQF